MRIRALFVCLACAMALLNPGNRLAVSISSVAEKPTAVEIHPAITPPLMPLLASRDFMRLPLVLPVPLTSTTPVTSVDDARPARDAGRAATTSPSPLESSSAVKVGPARHNSANPSVPARLTANQTYARSLVAAPQWPCLLLLWQRESGWRSTADNPTSTAYGIAQMLTETSSDPVVQIQHGVAYIARRYGDSCAALRHSDATGWY